MDRRCIASLAVGRRASQVDTKATSRNSTPLSGRKQNESRVRCLRPRLRMATSQHGSPRFRCPRTECIAHRGLAGPLVETFDLYQLDLRCNTCGAGLLPCKACGALILHRGPLRAAVCSRCNLVQCADRELCEALGLPHHLAQSEQVRAMQRALGEAQYAEQLTTAELRLREELLARLDDSNPDNPGAPSSNSNDGGNGGGAATAAAASAAASPPPAKRQRTTAHALSSSSASIHSSQSTSPGESLSQEEPLSYTELQWRHNGCRGRLHELDTPALRVADVFVASLSSPLPRVPVLTLGHLTALDAFYCQTGGSHIADGGSSGGSGSTPSFSQDLRDFGMDDSEESGATTARPRRRRRAASSGTCGMAAYAPGDRLAHESSDAAAPRCFRH